MLEAQAPAQESPEGVLVAPGALPVGVEVGVFVGALVGVFVELDALHEHPLFVFPLQL
jgi:hypothetical protein